MELQKSIDQYAAFESTENTGNENSDAVKHSISSVRIMVYLCIKRVFDLIVSVVLLIVLMIPMALIALLVRLNYPGSPVIRQKRIGQYGEVFGMYKFRTMYRFAPGDVATASISNMSFYTTPFGRFLRRTSIDELPQLLNVLIGNMSLVGFRPVVIKEENLNSLRKEYGVFECKPGMTGLAQVRGRDDISYKEKARIDKLYLKNRSVGLDLYILLKTIPVAVSQRGVK